MSRAPKTRSLPLLFQGARGESPLGAGLLLAPQGVGAALAMPLAGVLTDRLGAGRVVPAGLVLVIAGTLPFAVAGPSAPDPLLALALVLRGLGLGASTMPAMAAAYASLDEDAIARAASALNVVKRLGGSVGVALIAVVLEHHLPGATGSVGDRSGPVTDAFQRSSWWLVGFSVLALVTAASLPRRRR